MVHLDVGGCALTSDNQGIPDAVRELLRTRITNYEQLETLLLLNGHRERGWTSENVAQDLRIGTAAATAALEHLRDAGMASVVAGAVPSYRFAPADPTLQAACSQLARAWNENRLAVVDALTFEAMDRLRKSALGTFAEAFRLRRRKSDG